MERDQCGWPRSSTVEMLAVGASAAVENFGAAQRSASAQAEVICSGECRQQATIRDM